MRNLTSDDLKELFSYDKDTGVFIRIKPGRGTYVGRLGGYIDHQGYRIIGINGQIYKAHRLAWLYVTGEWPKNIIDHINGIKDDNRISNLRDVTHQVNSHNITVVPKSNMHGTLGASYHKNSKSWLSQISLNRKTINLGYYKTQEEAHAAYMAAKDKLHPTYMALRTN